MARVESLADIPHTRINAVHFFQKWIAAQPAGYCQNRVVYDFSTGSGYIAHLFQQAGAQVVAFDLFPNQNQFPELKCQFIDLQKPLPLADACADIVVCSETIECIPDQNQLFSELSRVLKPGGILLMSTANPSSLRSRFSQFIQESEHYSTPLPNEVNALVRWPGESRGYFSKLFIVGVLRIRTLAALHDLRIRSIHPSRGSSTAYLLLIWYPIIWYFSWKGYRKSIRQEPQHTSIYREIFEINTSFSVLTGKHLNLEFVKTVKA
jgi:SAM-dependent methyltransferase